jgi:hypothetical protein
MDDLNKSFHDLLWKINKNNESSVSLDHAKINNWRIEIALDLVWKIEVDVNKSLLTLNGANGELESLFPYICFEKMWKMMGSSYCWIT